MSNNFDLEYFTATIAAGNSVSASVSLGAKTPVSIFVPSGWTVAVITFLASPDGGTTWFPMDDEATGTGTSEPATAGHCLRIDPLKWRGFNQLQLRSGTLASPVVQAAAALILIGARL